MKSLNALIVIDVTIQKIFASIKRDTASAQEIIQALTVYARKDLRTLNACCTKAITQPIIKAV